MDMWKNDHLFYEGYGCRLEIYSLVCFFGVEKYRGVRHTPFRYLLTCTNSWPFNFHWQWLDCIDFQFFQTLMCRQWQFKIIVKHALWAIVRRMIISRHVIRNTMQNVFYLRKCCLQCWRGEKNWNNVTNKYHSCMEGSYSSCFEFVFQYGMEF